MLSGASYLVVELASLLADVAVRALALLSLRDDVVLRALLVAEGCVPILVPRGVVLSNVRIYGPSTNGPVK